MKQSEKIAPKKVKKTKLSPKTIKPQIMKLSEKTRQGEDNHEGRRSRREVCIENHEMIIIGQKLKSNGSYDDNTNQIKRQKIGAAMSKDSMLAGKLKRFEILIFILNILEYSTKQIQLKHTSICRKGHKEGLKQHKG